MKKAQNFNHPKAGSLIKVEPIKTTKDIRSIKKLLADNPRDLCLFTLGINTNLRASDLLNLKAVQVRDLKPMDSFELKEKKTGKARRITLNKACTDSVKLLLSSLQYSGKIRDSHRLNSPCCNLLVLHHRVCCTFFLYRKANLAFRLILNCQQLIKCFEYDLKPVIGLALHFFKLALKFSVI